MRFVKIKSNGNEFVQHVPKYWSNSRVKEELGDIFPIEKISNVPMSKVSKRDKSIAFRKE